MKNTYEINMFWLFILVGEEMALQLIPKDWVQIGGRSFPASVVVKLEDIKIQKEIGEGNFGKVFRGYLNLNEVTR